MKVLLTTLNAKYIHKNLALRWLYVSKPDFHDVDIKEYTIKEDIQHIAEELLSSTYEVIAFSVYIWNIEPTLEIIKIIKQQSNKCIVVGGPEVSYESYDLINQGVDAISLGEGEQAFWKYITNVETGVQEETVGIYTKAFPNKQFAYVDLEDNEKLENPYFLPFDEKDMQNRYFYFETSRGCPYACEYCLSSADSKVRLYSEDYVFGILEKIAKSKIRIVKLLDRTFNVQPKRALKIARFMNENCPNQIFQFEIVAETLSEELLDFFCEEADKERFRFEIGVQSFHEQTLKAVGRLQDNKRLREVITRLQQAKVVMHVDLIAGLPYEGFDRFKYSFNALYDLHVDEIQLGILKLLKGTKLKQKKDLYEYIYNPLPPYDILETKWLSEAELVLINESAHAVEKFYNSGMLRYTVDTLLELEFYEDAFSLFNDLGSELKKLKHPYQPHQMFQIVKDLLVDRDGEIVDGLLNYDYFKIFKQRPKLFLENRTSLKKRKEIMEMFVKKDIIKENEIYHYGHVETIYYKEKLGYQLILYSNKQTYPQRWFIDEGKIEVIK
ncbi:anaerobic magnesium-protoporphyrin IX monomethyl ester cyclase [Breznakia sp. PF5-3]|uniref:B12-binding domain-containing radical SAM protein n=1 Tax=unclassified Breznakia TaxID=2623764 RepID=UPI002404B18D|nr:MULTISPECIES: DUF4080 domain-containing protein [unclassified Breznakia]MDL2276204.1 DUF4080 domain-containing protein [Breznakia sp. OttesenSCG-928-G09]MDF9824725.1 anaerobic magnesium-protoporphyrin IX monomethyl ester cyclase [Breznakia sp. PM6-1]MDF9835388.1 anaerobic magnesium-protoporphyrin IX monomethyl ester cyclase [Breznakia sp. PF5-3]MDF9836987.1 anaerobic magnesium-protoporphyrin IX monomethyl ester cyclase [Breznakia sp. PFB2-8]MDF9859623.1 anaerobic magnesium-protoporphyrin IX